LAILRRRAASQSSRRTGGPPRPLPHAARGLCRAGPRRDATISAPPHRGQGRHGSRPLVDPAPRETWTRDARAGRGESERTQRPPPDNDNGKRRRDKRLEDEAPAHTASSENGKDVTRSTNTPLSYICRDTPRQKKPKTVFFYLLSRNGSLHCYEYQGIGYTVFLLGGRKK
jgi:hypothetical protein